MFIKRKVMLLVCIFVQGLSANAQEFKTIGYLPTYRFGLIEEINLEKLTHLNIAFANPDANGFLSTNGIDIMPIVQKAHGEGIAVFIALAGGGIDRSVWEDWILPSNRSNLIHNIVEYANEYELEGIDVDIEWGTVTDSYSGFVLELRDSLDKHDLLMTAALPGIYRYPEISDQALAAFDWINMMVYDLTGPWASSNPGPHSPYSFAENSIDYWVGQGVSKDRLTLGVPFYGYNFNNPANVFAMSYSQIITLYPDKALKDRVGQIFYNGLETIEQKTFLALDQLSGIMIWELGQDDFNEYSLLDRIDETIHSTLTSNENMPYSELELLLFPNPTQDIIHVKFESVPEAMIFLFSINGEVLQSKSIRNQDNAQFAVNTFPEGMYLIRFVSEGFSKSYKFFKM